MEHHLWGIEDGTSNNGFRDAFIPWETHVLRSLRESTFVNGSKNCDVHNEVSQ